MTKPKVGLLVTCLVDLMRPQVAFACVYLLERAGCEVIVPKAQTCCGQVTYNSGDRKHTQEIAALTIEQFQELDYVVGPSGSCLAMLRCHYPSLFANDEKMRNKAQALADKSYEILTFLSDVLDFEDITARFEGTVTYHDSCAGLRELGVKQQARDLLNKVQGLTIIENEATEECCGFGGTFCVKYPQISNRMVENKCEAIHATQADMMVAGDLGCLLNIAGKIKRQGEPIKVMHVVEVLAGMAYEPGIGDVCEG